MNARSALVALVLSAGCAAALAQDKLRVTGLYSNMKFGTEDVTGVEIYVVYSLAQSREAYWAIVQCAEGVPGKPLVAKLAVNKSNIQFVVPEDRETLCPSGTFTGTVFAKGLKGKFERMDWPGFLPRKKGYWQ